MTVASEPRRVLLLFGTRPEAIKLATMVRKLDEAEDFEPIVVLTGQHREMIDQVMAHFELTADHDLDVLRHGQSISAIMAKVLEGLDPLLVSLAPALVVVQGDTASALAGALTAFLRQIPVVHVEAGLRSGRRDNPFPEEMNRRLISELAAIHLAPTVANAAVLRQGGCDGDVVVTGNTVIDALHLTVASASVPPMTALATHTGPILLVTAHRRESWGAPMRSIAEGLHSLALRRPELLIVIPVHRNPTVRAVLGAVLDDVPNVELLEPLDYPAFVAAMARSTIILTDSGGVQEEAPSMGKPVLVMRATTERTEGIEAGTVRLIGTDQDRIVEEVERLLDDSVHYAAMAEARNPYGDGRATERSIAAIRRFLGDDVEVEEFRSVE